MFIVILYFTKVIPPTQKNVFGTPLEVSSALMPCTKNEGKELAFVLPFWQINVHIKVTKQHCLKKGEFFFTKVF